MPTREIKWFRRNLVLACDGNCSKAWGINSRPKVKFDPADPDDFAWLADDELGEAPADPGTYEGDDAKPDDFDLNKWCARECERSKKFEVGEKVELHDFSLRMYNLPSKHFPNTEEQR